MLENIFILFVSIYLIIKGATLATKYSANLAEDLHFSKYLIGFIIVAVISILPETFISINSALNGVPAFGLGTLFGSNVADLTLAFAIIILYSNKSVKIESKILKNSIIYPFILMIPIALGLDGHFSRIEGISLIIAGAIFYFMAFKNNTIIEEKIEKEKHWFKNISMLLISMAILLLGAHFVVTSATSIASDIGISSILIGMFVVGLGSIIPELLFSIKAVKKDEDSLAIGDMLGTVLADATIVVGIIALIQPFEFPIRIIYITGIFMILACFVLFYFMKSEKKISKKEAILLLLFWIIFVIVEISIN